jgi:hypothetical protein
MPRVQAPTNFCTACRDLVGQVVKPAADWASVAWLRRRFVGRPILAAAGFQPALFVPIRSRHHGGRSGTLEVDSGATTLGSGEPADYPLRDSAFGDDRKEYSSLIYAEDAENVTIRGRGTIDGPGKYWWRGIGWPNRLKIPRDQRTPEELAQIAPLVNGRPQLIQLVRSTLVAAEQLHPINLPSWTIRPQLCEFVRIDAVNQREGYLVPGRTDRYRRRSGAYYD